MNIFKNKFLINLIATLCLFLALISFGAPTTVQAGGSDDDDGWGGVLISPVVKLLTALGDGVMELLHSSVQSQGVSMIKLDGSNSWDKILPGIFAVAIGIIAAAAVIVATIYIGGVAFPSILTAIGATTATAGTTITLGVIAASGVTGYLVGKSVYEGWIPDDIYLPAFTVSAEEIFSNEIALFDINFFSNDTTKYGMTEEVIQQDIFNETYTHYNPDSVDSEYEYLVSGNDGCTPKELYELQSTTKQKKLIEDCFNAINKKANENITWTGDETSKYEIDFLDSSYNTYENLIQYHNKIAVKSDKGITYEIFYRGSAKEMYDVDGGMIINPGEINSQVETTETVTIKANGIIKEPIISTAQQLKGVVSKWYFILQNLALLILMVVLIYTGIRIVLASTAGDKAKYKERLIDWIVAMCLLFIMHYIMVFAVEIADKITNLVEAGTGLNENFRDIHLTDTQLDSAKEFFNNDEYGKRLISEKIAELDENQKLLIWRTDLVGAFRIESQLTDEGTGKWVGYSFSYFVLVLFTIFFAWTYLKRIVYMAFLTMIAPLVAMTYPIDKITDGKAQAFNAWLKEYIFNLLIQPMHLILYAVLVSSAFELASDSVLYALVALGFMIPAEKLMRKFFGFEKASTPGLLGGAAGAALAMTGINKLLGHRPKGGSSGGKNSGGNESKDSAKINFKSKDAVSAMKGIAGEPSGTPPGTPPGTPSGTPPGTPPGTPSGTPSGTPPGTPSGTPSGTPPGTPPGTPSGTRPGTPSGTPTRTLPRMLKGTLASSGAYYRTLGKRIGNKIQNGHPIRAMARGAAGLAGAATFGAAGLAMGVVSGDPSKAFQYASAGALGGYKLSSSTVGAVQRATSVDEEYLQEQYELAAYGDEYKNYVLEQEKQKMQENEKYINYLQKTMSVSRERAQGILSTTGAACFDSGITNVEDIATIHKMTEGEDSISLNEAIGAKKFNDLLPSDVSKMDDDKRRKYVNTWKIDYENAGYGEKSGDWAQKSMDYAIKFADTQSSLKKSQV